MLFVRFVRFITMTVVPGMHQRFLKSFRNQIDRIPRRSGGGRWRVLGTAKVFTGADAFRNFEASRLAAVMSAYP